MAEPPQTETHKTRSFLRCFGFSGKKMTVKEKPTYTCKTTTKSKTRWPIFRLNVLRKYRTKTVPVDSTEKTDSDHSKHKSKLIKKKSDSTVSTSIPQSPNKADRQVPSSSDQASSENPEQQFSEPNIILGNRNLLDPTRTGSSRSLPGSPVNKPKHKAKSISRSKLSHAVSLPPALDGKKNQQVGNPRKLDGGINIKETQRNNNVVVEKIDPLMGMSIIMVTLIIMLVWGRLCAILCTSAWFYFCPRFRTTAHNNHVSTTSISNDLDLNSEHYKKKVVLEGLLERNNHRFTYIMK